MARVGISLGSNLGERLELLRNAVTKLESIQSRDHLLCSRVYETAPIDCPPGSPLFLNCVIEIETDLLPQEVLRHTQAIEQELGRVKKKEINEPRPVDLDLLYYDDAVIEEPNLTLPHPRMPQRAFVALPLLEIRPDLSDRFSAEIIKDQSATPVTDRDWLQED